MVWATHTWNQLKRTRNASWALLPPVVHQNNGGMPATRLFLSPRARCALTLGRSAHRGVEQQFPLLRITQNGPQMPVSCLNTQNPLVGVFQVKFFPTKISPGLLPRFSETTISLENQFFLILLPRKIDLYSHRKLIFIKIKATITVKKFRLFSHCFPKKNATKQDHWLFLSKF